MVDEDGMPVTPRSYASEDDRSPSPEHGDRPQSGKKAGGKGKKQGEKYPKDELDDKHLYAVSHHHSTCSEKINKSESPVNLKILAMMLLSLN